MNRFKDYSFENDDIFNRRDLARNLSKVVEESNNSVVLALDSYWGSGKTIFIKKWKNSLETEGTKAIYLDAWENDYFKDPIVPLIGHLESILELDKVTNEDVKVALKTIMYEIVKSVSTVVHLDKIESSFSTTERSHLNLFKNLDSEKKLIKSKLEDISRNRKIYFFIDELDRCKPLFSIKLLERIKHYFDLDNFIFVLAVDLGQLGKSIKSIYGDIDTKAYFRKFFDLNFHLPSPEKNIYFEFLFSQAGIEQLKNHQYVEYITMIIKNCNHLGLRECEKIFKILQVCHHKIVEVKDHEYIFPYLIVFKVLEPEKYKDILAKKIVINESFFANQKLNIVYHGYDDEYKHVQNTIKVLSPYTINERLKAGIKAFNEDINRKAIVNGFHDYMSKILEFTNLF